MMNAFSCVCCSVENFFLVTYFWLESLLSDDAPSTGRLVIVDWRKRSGIWLGFTWLLAVVHGTHHDGGNSAPGLCLIV